MTDLTVSPDLLAGAPTLQRGPTAKMRETAEAFEASFLSQMLKPMFEGLETEGTFGGGEAEGTWRTFLIDAMAKQTAKAGGIGLADDVMAEMMKMQEMGRMTADAAASLNASARLRQLSDLTRRLTERLTVELAAFEARRPQDAMASLPQTQELANVYRRESAQVKANPTILSAAPAADRMALIRDTEAFEAVLGHHARAVEAARIISEGLVRAIAAEVTEARGTPSAYGATGKASSGDGRAVAFNRTA